MDALMKYIGRIYRSSGLWRVDKLSEEGLSGIQHFYIFQIVRRPGISQEKLAEHIMVNKSNVARQLSAMEAAGLVVRKGSSEDKRVLEVYPTEKALEIYPKVVALMKQWNELITEDLTEEEKKVLESVLPKMAKRAKELCEGK